MTDSRLIGAGAFGPEPDPDHELGGLLRDVVGAAPTGAVDWTALGARISVRIDVQTASPWWMYAMQWERRVIPLALAAGIAAAAALWPTAPASPTPLTSASALATAVASGAPAEDAASQLAGSITNAVDLSAGVPQ